MKKFLFIALCCVLGGCIGYRVSHVKGNINGTNIQTPYGPATGNFQYDATTCLGNCPEDKLPTMGSLTLENNKTSALISSELTNAIGMGPAINTSK